MSNAPYFELNNISAFQGQNKVFDNVSISFNLNEHCCILGPNGAGKSTLLKLLYRQIHPVVKPQSDIKWFGETRWETVKLKQFFGLVSQDFQNQYDAHIRGFDVVLSGLYSSIGIHGHMQISQDDKQIAEATMERFNLLQLKDRPYWHLSTGQQRRLLLARAMINNPKILVLDEPTNGLDLQASFELLAELRLLCSQHTTVLLVTHHLQEIIPEISRVVTLKDGEVTGDDNKQNMLTNNTLSELYQTPITVKEQNGYYQAFPDRL